jgi:hypothetical protein
MTGVLLYRQPSLDPQEGEVANIRVPEWSSVRRVVSVRISVGGGGEVGGGESRPE